MGAEMERLSAWIGNLATQAKVRKRLVAILAILLFLQLYFVRELIAAELLFGLGFLVLAALGVIFYVVGLVGERSFRLLDGAVRASVPLARRIYPKIEEISRKQLRHFRSQSAQ
jgi:hypothetical protein